MSRPRKGIVGSGITARTARVYAADAEEGQAALREAVQEWLDKASELGAFGATVEDVKEACIAVVADGDAEQEEQDSPEDFARSILDAMWHAFDRIEHGDADEAARMGFHVGRLWAEARIKWDWEDHALRGKKTIQSAQVGGEVARRQHDAEWGKRRARMSALVPKFGVKGAAEICAKEGLGNAEAIRKQWNRRRES